MRTNADSQLIALTERSRRELVDVLCLKYQRPSLADIKTIAETADVEIISFLNRALIEHANTLFGLSVGAGPSYLVDRRGNSYYLALTCDLADRGQVAVLIQEVRRDMIGVRECVIDINCYGSIKTITLVFPVSLSSSMNLALAKEWIKVLVESGYNWFYEIASRLTNTQLEDLARRLYQHARLYVRYQQLGKNLWFSAIVKGIGFRLLDPDVVKSVFEVIASHIEMSSRSTNVHVADLLATQLPERMMLMRSAIDRGECVDVSIREAEYRKEGSLYATTMNVLYGCDSFTIYPVFKGNDLSIGAVFDTKLRESLEPILDEHKSVLEAMCRDYREPGAPPLRLHASLVYRPI